MKVVVALGVLTQKYSLDKEGELFALLGGMRLMNLLVGNNDIAADKDPETMPKSHAEEIRCSSPWDAHYADPSSFSSAGVYLLKAPSMGPRRYSSRMPF